MKKKILAVLLILCFVLAWIPARSYAVAAAVTATDLWLTMWGAYAASHGLTNKIMVDGIPATSANPASSQMTGNLTLDLVKKFAGSSWSDNYLEDWKTSNYDAISFTVGANGNIVASLAVRAVQWFDTFANWLLGDELGMQRTDNGYAVQDLPADTSIVSNSSLSINGVQPISMTNGQLTRIYGFYSFMSKPVSYDNFYANGVVYIWCDAVDQSNHTSHFSAMSLQPFRIGVRIGSASSGYGAMSGVLESIQVGNYYTAGIGNSGLKQNGINESANIGDMPYIPSVPSSLDANALLQQGSSIDLGATDVNEGVIGIPDTEDQDYAPDAISVPLDVAAEGDLTYPLGIEAILAKILANDLVTEADPGGGGDDPGDDDDPDDFQSPGLADVFPFCLPFDLYAFFSCLAADPVAPRFEIPFEIPNLVNYTFVIDLSTFDSVAQILRTMELLAFCVALILITRDKMIRG